MISGKKAAKVLHDPTKHYPNKMEAKMLRRIMSETGLNEEEVRKDIKYRKMLSEASKSNEQKWYGKVTKFYRNIIKSACKETGLVPQHPDTVKVIEDKLSKYRNGTSWSRPWYLYWYGGNIPNAKTVVRDYAKK